MVLFQAAEQRQEARSGHGHVQNDHVGGRVGELREQVVAVDGFAHDLNVRLLAHELVDAGADQRMVVGDEQPDHPALPAAAADRSMGMKTRTVVPRPGSPRT